MRTVNEVVFQYYLIPREVRAQYLREFRANMEDTLRRVRVEQADGTYKPLVKKDKLN